MVPMEFRLKGKLTNRFVRALTTYSADGIQYPTTYLHIGPRPCSSGQEASLGLPLLVGPEPPITMNKARQTNRVSAMYRLDITKSNTSHPQLDITGTTGATQCKARQRHMRQEQSKGKHDPKAGCGGWELFQTLKDNTDLDPKCQVCLSRSVIINTET